MRILKDYPKGDTIFSVNDSKNDAYKNGCLNYGAVFALCIGITVALVLSIVLLIGFISQTPYI